MSEQDPAPSEEAPPAEASALTRGTAMAVDLALSVACAGVGFAVVSWFTPLDGNAAKGPMLVLILGALLYAGWARSFLPSPGRIMFGLRTYRLPGPIPGTYGKLITVHAKAQPDQTLKPVASAVLTIGLATVFSAAGVAESLTNTSVFEAASSYVRDRLPLQSKYGAAPELSSLPRALLVGKTRAYVQIGARWGDHSNWLDIHLQRAGEGWQVIAVAEAEPGQLADFALSVPDSELPALPITPAPAQ